MYMLDIMFLFKSIIIKRNFLYLLWTYKFNKIQLHFVPAKTTGPCYVICNHLAGYVTRDIRITGWTMEKYVIECLVQVILHLDRLVQHKTLSKELLALLPGKPIENFMENRSFHSLKI